MFTASHCFRSYRDLWLIPHIARNGTASDSLHTSRPGNRCVAYVYKCVSVPNSFPFLGGAERLVVDAAVGLQKLGHTVEMFTSHHDPDHCFDETRDGGWHTRNDVRAVSSLTRT